MSGSNFSNAETGGKPADPYKAKNIDEASLKEKVEDLVSFVEACKFGMMTTRQGESGLLVSRCMALAGKEGGGVDLLFHTNTESGKTDDLTSDPNINIAFLNGSGEWASLSGKSEVITDRSMVKKYYSVALKAWIGDLGDGTHDGGPDDPRIAVIKVTAVTATYAISRRGAIGRGVEMAKGVVTGEAPSVNKLREISTEELETCEYPFSVLDATLTLPLPYAMEGESIHTGAKERRD
ncbi:MAG: BLI-3 blue-light-inducible Bli-3 protein [Sclerophora amabilis]|nr:MAG: BLI-3 blue-light-inducible Bli-3 protein [Sclerophora amabilis]